MGMGFFDCCVDSIGWFCCLWDCKAMEYCKLKLSNGDTVSVDEITGGTLMQAALMAGPVNVQNSHVLGLYLFAVAVKKDNQCVGITYIQSLSIDDLNTIIESCNSQSIKIKK